MVLSSYTDGHLAGLGEDLAVLRQDQELDILGTTSNSRGWGVRVLSVVGDKILYQQKYALNGHLSTSDLPIHIGLGTEDEAEEIYVIWPSGKTKTLRSVPAGSRLIVEEPS